MLLTDHMIVHLDLNEDEIDIIKDSVIESVPCPDLEPPREYSMYLCSGLTTDMFEYLKDRVSEDNLRLTCADYKGKSCITIILKSSKKISDEILFKYRNVVQDINNYLKRIQNLLSNQNSRRFRYQPNLEMEYCPQMEINLLSFRKDASGLFQYMEKAIQILQESRLS